MNIFYIIGVVVVVAVVLGYLGPRLILSLSWSCTHDQDITQFLTSSSLQRIGAPGT